MSNFLTSVKTFLETEDGPTAVEYAVMLALILVACIATVQTLGTSANSKFEEINGYLGGGAE
ncbi:Flp family type IVb pilin [Alienimonas chondri]|uniref:Flp family type IVb pilin n=1 Tax=Alienimonas chondri TaxID=2681879 RepID=A0ABX1VBY2_9PLAN|nr:Flp family type IVb pilin [Alienimonas chondri]NNJ24848.1 hypothetical protein [Alienimonas chondri]